MLQIGIREPGSAITHFIAMMMAIFATSPLLVKAALNGNHTTILAMAVFMGSMVLLYGASTVYHSLVVRDKILKIFRKLDHMMIFVLIAGSYTPVCLIVLGGKSGYTLLAAVWGIAAAGMLIKVLWINCPKWFSSVIYIAMGWVCLFVFRELLATLSQAAFLWLLAGVFSRREINGSSPLGGSFLNGPVYGGAINGSTVGFRSVIFYIIDLCLCCPCAEA